jgi:integrase
VPPVGLLRERNIRTGFFEPGEFRAVVTHLPAALSPVAEFAYLTGWRKGEVLSLTWAQVDFTAGMVRLEPGSTKNDDGRAFPFSALPALGALLTRQRDYTRAVERATGQVVRSVFHRQGQPIRYFRRAWEAACIAAGLVPGGRASARRRGGSGKTTDPVTARAAVGATSGDDVTSQHRGGLHDGQGGSPPTQTRDSQTQTIRSERDRRGRSTDRWRTRR